MEHVVYRSRFGVSASALFGFHEREDAFERLVPPWEKTRVVERSGGIKAGGRAVIETRLAPGVWKRWVALHEAYVPGVEFVDRAESGPFAYWRHVHRVVPDGVDAAWLEDDITYALPLGALGSLVAGRWVRGRLDAMFAWRHAETGRLLGVTPTKGSEA